MKVIEDDIRGLLAWHGELERDQICTLLGADRTNVSFPLRNLLPSGEVIEEKPGSLRDMLPSRFTLASSA